ncbi:MAG TPA: serine/threonine-protein kinase [Polyangia bacterium]|nr:serine/threonine-protein kinase [Polyangia bacterium]
MRYLTAGGMADLYLARHPSHVRELVVKKIQPRYVEFTRVVKMFIDEGRIAQALHHPNIVEIVDVGQRDGTYFIAMEYIPGRDLLAVCRRGVEVGNFMARHVAVAILEQALRGLSHAHEKRAPDGTPLRVVHCDVSPGNIVVSWGGTVKIVDFGIARATIQLRAEDHTVAGKYNYMAPEQIRGEPVDARADLFALGIILYELTVGKRLFRGRPEQVMKLVLEDPIVPPTALRPDYPPRLEKIVMRALARDPAERHPSARAMREDLRNWLAEEGMTVGKRQLAEYMRAVFGAEKKREADEFTSDHEDEDLVLERALPGASDEPLHVDPEDPEDDTAPIAIRVEPEKPAPQESAPQKKSAPHKSAPRKIDDTRKTPPADEITRPSPRPPPPAGAYAYTIPLLIGTLAVLALLAFFLLRR